MSGGNFWQGFASGALSSLASSLYGGSGYKNAEGNFVPQTRGLNGIIGGGEVGMIAFGTIAGGAGAALTKGNFWQGAATGLMVSGLNHVMHQMDGDDNGYDKNGKQINNKGGDTTDYLYDEKGNIIDSKPVEFIGAISQGEFRDLGGFRGYGFKGFPMATGAIAEDNTIAGGFIGGIAVKGAGSILSSESASLVLKYSNTLNKGNWWRLGEGFNPATGLRNIRLAWGAHPNYLSQVPKFLQGLNTSLRNFAGGHIHFPNWKP
ncbi:MAG: hypothetical protein KGZ87_00525 [Bacteroidetes bacterium]|nr:hypothetical protein [Bacteroidota bacterium]